MDIDEALAPLREAGRQEGWPDPAQLRGIARRRRTVRRRATAVVAAAVVAGAAVTVIRSPSPGSNPSGDRPVAGALQLVGKVSALPTRDGGSAAAVARAEQGFAVDLLRRSTPGHNSALSPVSLAVALAMLQTGARGSTSAEIAAALHTSGLSAQQQDTGWAALVSDLSTARQVKLESANSLWTQRGLPVQQHYLNALAQYFGTGVWQVDFAGNPAGAKQAINAWTRNKTHGRITKLFDYLDPLTVVVLANAIYFKAAWQTTFDMHKTAPGRFHRAHGSTISTPFLNTSTDVTDRVTDTWQSAQIPYAGGRYSALLVMPTKATLAGLIDTLTPQRLSDFADTRRDPQGELSLPKFELSTFTDLVPTLKSLGIRTAFTDAADLAALSAVPLKVSQVVQRDYLKVDDNGTEAAAVTGIGGVAMAARVPSLRSFDHPFLFLVRDRKTGAIVFDAQIYDPSHS